MKLLIVNDPHIAASPPLGCNDIYIDDVFNMLEECQELAADCKFTIFTGDIFHAKRNVPHWLVRKVIELFKEWPGYPLTIAGNHDMRETGIESIPSQPLGVVIEGSPLTLLEHDEIGIDEGVEIQFSPLSYFDEIDDDPNHFGLVRNPRVHWAAKVSHGSLIKPGKKLPDGFKAISMDRVPTRGMDIVYNGHIHNDQGIHEINGCTFVSLGSLGRVANAEYNRKRKVKVALTTLDYEEMTVEAITLKSQCPADELFKDKVLGEVDVDDAMKRFARELERSLRIEETPIDEVLAEVAGKGVEPEVYKAVKRHLEEGGYE